MLHYYLHSTIVFCFAMSGTVKQTDFVFVSSIQSERIDSLVNFIPFQYYVKETESDGPDTAVTAGSVKISSTPRLRADSSQNTAANVSSVLQSSEKSNRVEGKQLKRFASLEWMSTIERMKYAEKQKRLAATSSIKSVKLKRKRKKWLSNGGITTTQPNEVGSLGLSDAPNGEYLWRPPISQESLKHKFAAKMEALRKHKQLKIENQRSNGNNTTVKLSKATMKHALSTEGEENRSFEFGTFSFPKPTSEIAIRSSDQNKKGSKIKRIKASIKALKKEKEAIFIAKGEQKQILVKSMQMEKALNKAKGERVPENVSSLSKSEKFLRRRKLKSKKRWKERIKS